MVRLDSSIFSFLKDLRSNNNRNWFNENKTAFKNIEYKIKSFASNLFDELNKHDNIETYKVFRIYRDIRFSKNKTPYKTNFGISFKRKKPDLRGGYYLHLEPNKTFIAAGFWNPNKDDITRIRNEFINDADEFRSIIESKSINSIWGSMRGEVLKSAPRGFSRNETNIDLIKMKQYIFIKEYRDKNLYSDNILVQFSESFKTIRPFFNYMSDILTTDLNGVSII
tara:strand:+ start:718 stop:1389 length:672 start_codon:yes stop_codon:yes gene_type:complete